MVFLKDLHTQFPWNSSDTDFSNKKIYTFDIEEDDEIDCWRVPIYAPDGGYAYTGIRIHVKDKDANYIMTPYMVIGATDRAMFGLPWDRCIAKQDQWVPLGFPLTNKILAISEDGLEMMIRHTMSCSGYVEFIAHRFDDLCENERDLSYIFLNHRTDKVEWILNADNRMYKPRSYDNPTYNQKSKIMPSVLRLLDKERAQWKDTSQFWDEVDILMPLLVESMIPTHDAPVTNASVTNAPVTNTPVTNIPATVNFNGLRIPAFIIEALESGFEAVSSIEGGWDALHSYEPPENQGFMFGKNKPPKIKEIEDKVLELYSGHSGGSFGDTMRYLEFIAKKGWEGFVQRFGPAKPETMEQKRKRFLALPKNMTPEQQKKAIEEFKDVPMTYAELRERFG